MSVVIVAVMETDDPSVKQCVWSEMSAPVQ